MNQTVLSSPAKLNLYLKVRSKRSDGYHDIETVFQRIDLADIIKFRANASGKIRVTCNHPHVPIGPKNLVYKVARLLQSDLNVNQGVQIDIKKNIPVAAGLAGGSSNAATALLGLNKVWKLRLSKNKLLDYAKKIGSDVPFFLYDTSWALGTERGDNIKSLNINRKLWQILVVPRVKIYSWKVYQGLKWPRTRSNKGLKRYQGATFRALKQKNGAYTNALTHSKTTKKDSSRPTLCTPQGKKGRCTNVLTKKNDNANILIRNLKKDSILDVGRCLSNDLEHVVIRLAPGLKKLKERLKSLNTNGVMVSGSGPGVYGLTATKQDAEHIKSILSKRFSQVFVVRTL